MRILAYLYYPFFDQHLAGGLQVAVRTLIHGFLKRGHQVRVLCPEGGSRTQQEVPGLEVMPVLKDQSADGAAPEDVSHNLREVRTACEGVDLAWSLDRPFPTKIPQPIVLGLSAICYANELEALFRLNWDHLVVPSNYVARVVDSWLPPDSGRTAGGRRSCVPPPLDPIFRRRLDTGGIRSKLGLRGDCRYLLFPHRPEDGKGHEVALRVLDELLRQDHRFHLLVPKPPISTTLDGESEARFNRRFEAQAAEWGLRAHVTFHEWIDYRDLPAYYSLGDCCLYLSQLPETFGLALVQSIACETFVVSSGAGALKDTVPPGYANVVVPDPDPGAIARAVLAGCPEAEIRRGRALVLERYAPDPIIDAYLECFSAAIQATRPLQEPVHASQAEDIRVSGSPGASEIAPGPVQGGSLTQDSSRGTEKLTLGVTVITISRRRPELLQRCMRSVENQSYKGTLKHLVVADDCVRTMAFLARGAHRNGHVRYLLAARRPAESSGPPRLAKLRNYAATLVDTAWTAFLDDDNEYDGNHIISLLDCAMATGCPAVHSHRQLLYFEGGPYLEPRWPWCRDPKRAEEYYWELIEKGVLKTASNVVKDRVDLSPDGGGIMMVDTNVWLIRTEVLQRVKISDQFSYQDWLDNLAEDNKLLEALVAAGVKIACSGQASLKYYLGGYSSDLKREYSHSEPWLFNGNRKQASTSR